LNEKVYLKMQSSANFVEAGKTRRQKVEARIFFLLQGSEARNSDCLKLGFSISFIEKLGFKIYINLIKQARSSDFEMKKLGFYVFGEARARILKHVSRSRARQSSDCTFLYLSQTDGND